nr:hypothetical protein [Tanacetum cinerariifolium]
MSIENLDESFFWKHVGAEDLRTLKLDRKSANNEYGSPFVKIYAHVYGIDIITVDQGRCEKWGMKLTKEVVNLRCLSYNIRNPVVEASSRCQLESCKNYNYASMLAQEYRPLSKNCKAKNNLYGSKFDNRAKCLIAVDALLADNVDIWRAGNKYPGVIVNESFIFVTHSLFPVRISKGMKKRLRDRGGGGGGGSGGGGVVGGVDFICGDGVDSGVGGVERGVVCGFVCGVVCGGVC